MPESPRIEELKRRVQVDPASIAFAALAEEYRRAGRFEEAITTCQAGLQRHPAYLSARVTLGRALLELNRFEEAREELTHVLRAAPENLAAIRGLAEIHHRRGELPEALEQYRSALNVAKHDAEIEQAVEEISKRVGGDEPGGAVAAPERTADPLPHADGPAEPEAPTEPRRPVPLSRPRLELVTWSPAPPQPEPEAAVEQETDTAQPVAPLVVVAPEPADSLAAAFDLLSAAPAAAQVQPVDPEPLADATLADVTIADVTITDPTMEEPAIQAAPDPALPALEAFLGAILREKAALAQTADRR